MTATGTRVSKKYKDLGFFLAVIIIIRCRPFYLWDYEDIIRPICAVIVTLIAACNLSKEKWTKPIFVLLSASYLWATVVIDHSSIVTVFNFLGFAFIPIIKKQLILATYDAFRKIFIVIVALSFISYLFSLIGLFHIGTFKHENGPDLYTYEHYPFLVRGLGIMGETSYKFQALFDEPGFLGTVSGLLLISQRMDFTKKGNVLLLICSMFTLSFYFYVSLIFGMLFFAQGISKYRWWIIGIFILFFILTYRISFMYDNIWYRFEYDAETGRIAGDNRNGRGLREYFDTIIWSPIVLTGLGTEFAEKFSGAASLILVILKHGLIFVILNVGAFLLFSYREIKEKSIWIMFFFFFVLTLYQRPGFYATSSIFLYTMVIYKFGEIQSNAIPIRQKKKHC